mgnify:CR=1 FL=1
MCRIFAHDPDDLSSMQGDRARSFRLVAHPASPPIESLDGGDLAGLERDEVELLERDVRRKVRQVVAQARGGVRVVIVRGGQTPAEARGEFVGTTAEAAEGASDLRCHQFGVIRQSGKVELTSVVDHQVETLDEHAGNAEPHQSSLSSLLAKMSQQFRLTARQRVPTRSIPVAVAKSPKRAFWPSSAPTSGRYSRA